MPDDARFAAKNLPEMKWGDPVQPYGNPTPYSERPNWRRVETPPGQPPLYLPIPPGESVER